MLDYDTLAAFAYGFLALAAAVAALTGYAVATGLRGRRSVPTTVVTVTRTTDAELQRAA